MYFDSEQYRVLKENGVCIVLSARKGINIVAPCIAEETEFEKDIWQRVEKHYSDIYRKYEICAFPQNEAELPQCMEQHGFHHVTTAYITVNLTPDNPHHSSEMAQAIINANRQCSLDGAERLLHVAGDVVTASEVEELKRIVNAKYDKRIMLYHQRIKQWDANMSVTMIVRGVR